MSQNEGAALAFLVFFSSETGLRFGGPAKILFNLRDGLHSGWAGYMKMHQGGLEHIDSTPDFVEVVVRGFVLGVFAD